jgi:luciferase family oxidoreductase group 1
MIPFSILDLSPIVEGGDAAGALRNTIDLAQHAEAWGYHRYWLAEHHNIPSVASAATAVLIGAVAAKTASIRVGAGGIMLPNHPPLVIAEQFGTLECLHPGRIDLALGRAPGSDPITARALRRNPAAADSFPDDVLELMMYFEDRRGHLVKAVPGAGLHLPIWILGSSVFGAELAANLGLPYAFASHFAPGLMMDAIRIYRERFRPSPRHERPHLMLAINVVAAATDDEAARLFTSHQLAFITLRRGMPGPLPPPDPAAVERLTAPERSEIDQTLSVAAIGSPDRVRRELGDFVARTGADELILVSQIYDHRARLRSYELVAAMYDHVHSGHLR